MSNDFYVYEWFNTENNEVFYVGKGCGKRFLNTTQRNEKFKEYIQQNKVDVRKVKENLTEEEAFTWEKIITDKYKEKGQCQCSLAPAGKGGYQFVWTDEMRKYWSEYNPMKKQAQRERMSKNNPMKNKEVAERVGKAHRKAVIINGIEYDSIAIAAKELDCSTTTIGDWCRKGKNPRGWICEYKDKGKKHSSSIGTPVIVDGIYYNSIAEASYALDLIPSSLSRALKNNKPLKNHICEYANQQPSQ